MTENVEFIDEVIYEELIKNNDMEKTNSEWDPYFIKISGSFEKYVYLKTKPYGLDVIKFNFEADKDKKGNLIGAKDDKIIKKLNEELNTDTFNGESIKNNVMKLKEFLKEKRTENKEETIKEKEERTEESQESKKNSETVIVGETYEYQGKNRINQVGEISNTQGDYGEHVNDVTLLSQKTPAPTGGKRKSKKSKKPKKSKKSKTRKNSRKTNRRR